MAKLFQKLLFTSAIVACFCVIGAEDTLLLTTSKTAKQTNFIQQLEEIGQRKIKHLTANDIQNIEDSLKAYKLVLLDMETVSKVQFNAFLDYVRNGGSLVTFGQFGSTPSGNAGDKKSAIHGRQELTGATIFSKHLSIEKVRILNQNPVFRNFKVGKWLDYSTYKPSCFPMTIDSQTVPLADAFYRPFGYKAVAFQYKYWDSRFAAMFNCYATAKQTGRGVVVSIAESLYIADPSKPFFKALWRNLLRLSTYSILHNQLNHLKQSRIEFADGNLLPNTDFTYRCPVQGKLPSSNSITGNVLIPANWYFNSWKGNYCGNLIKGKDNKYTLMFGADSEDVRSGGSSWNDFNYYGQLKPGKKYRLTVSARGQNVTRASFGVQLVLHGDKRETYDQSLPQGTFEWKQFSYNFQVPLVRQNNKKLARGLRGFISFTGPGKLYARDLSLVELSE
jgi:hypothetical protein